MCLWIRPALDASAALRCAKVMYGRKARDRSRRSEAILGEMTESPDPADLPDDARPEARPMASLPHARTDASTASRPRLAASYGAAGATLAAACVMLGVGAVARSQGFGGIRPATSLTAVILFAAAIGVLVPWLREGGLVLLWNSLGVAIALLVVGILNVGAIVAFPVALIGLAVAAWPRGAERVGIVPCAIALIGGLGVIPAAHGLAGAIRWLDGMV